MMITLACTFTYAFKDAFGHSRDRGYFCVGIQLSDTKQPSMPISAQIYGVTGFSYFGHDFRSGNHDLFVVKALIPEPAQWSTEDDEDLMMHNHGSSVSSVVVGDHP